MVYVDGGAGFVLASIYRFKCGRNLSNFALPERDLSLWKPFLGDQKLEIGDCINRR